MVVKIPLRMLKKFFDDEVIAMSIYRFMIRKSKDKREVFEKLSKMEQEHADFWQNLAREMYGKTLKIGLGLRLKILWSKFIALITPLTFMVNYLELGEREAYIDYAKLLDIVKENEAILNSVKEIIYDEIKHEDELLEIIIGEKSRLARIKDAIYGMTDSLVEILALVIGLASVIKSPLTIGLAGLISAVGGTFSMTSGAYLSSKSQNDLYEGSLQEIKIKETLATDLLETDLERAFIEKGLDVNTVKSLIEAVKEKPEALRNLIKSLAIEETPTNPAEVAKTTGLYYVLGALPAILPFFIAEPFGLSSVHVALIAVSLAIIVSFITGIFTGVLSGINIRKKAIENVLIIVGATIATYLIGTIARIILGIEV